jgi:hypothetical protein
VHAGLPVFVILDMDAVAPGIQSSITVAACTELVEDVAVYVVDPTSSRMCWSIGYLGGIDRGIALGHMPSATNGGSVVGLTPEAGEPVNPGNTIYFMQSPAVDPGFAGPEVQYVEFGANAPR